jgi:subtilisin-like proprotein convertase family protein
VCGRPGLGVIPAVSAAKVKTAQFIECATTAVPIPDGPIGPTDPNPAASFAVPVNVPKIKGKPQDGVVTGFNSVGVQITHTDDADLSLFLVSPGGRAVALATYRDDSSAGGHGYGSGAPGCAGSRVDFSDRNPTSIATPGNTGANDPILGAFRPEQPLSTFVGGPARGFWTLIVQDVAAPDVGQINALAMSFDYQYRVKPHRKKKR